MAYRKQYDFTDTTIGTMVGPGVSVKGLIDMKNLMFAFLMLGACVSEVDTSQVDQDLCRQDPVHCPGNYPTGQLAQDTRNRASYDATTRGLVVVNLSTAECSTSAGISSCHVHTDLSDGSWLLTDCDLNVNTGQQWCWSSYCEVELGQPINCTPL